MQRLYDSLEGEDFEILAVSVDAPVGESDEFGRPGGDLEAFADELGLTFPILHNPSGDIQRIYQTTGVPESFVIGRDGTIYKKVAGPTQWDATVNEELVRRLLAG
jgi:peroxiredoxin